MRASDWDLEWGDWVLGDLSDVFQRAADLLGRTNEVARVTMTPPASDEQLPHITLTVPDEQGIFRLRGEITQGEYEVEFVGKPQNQSWQAEVAGFVLTVATEG